MPNRLDYYRIYKRISNGRTKYGNTTWPDGSAQFWSNAVVDTENKIRIREEEKQRKAQIKREKQQKKAEKERRVEEAKNVIAATINDLYKTASIKNITFNKDLTKKLFFSTVSALLRPENKLNILVQIGDLYYTLTRDNLSKIMQVINNGYVIPGIRRADEITESDTELIDNIRYDIDEITIESYDPTIPRGIRNGKFFKYYIKDKFLFDQLNLKRYGIYTGFNKKDLREYCLIHAFEQSGQLNTEELDYMRIIVKNRAVPVSCIKMFAEKYNLFIKILVIDLNGNNRKTIKYGNNSSNRTFNLALIDDHYIIDEQVKINKYALENYDKIKHLKDWNKISGINNKNSYCRRERFINSSDMVRYFIRNKDKYLIDITHTDDIYKTQYYDLVREINNLNYDPEICTRITESKNMKEKRNNKENNLKRLSEMPMVFFDCETDVTGEFHEEYIICASFYDKNSNFIENKTFWNVKSFFDYIKEESLLIAHNLGYDFRFVINSKHLFDINILDKGKSIMQCSASYKNYNDDKTIKLHFKDSAYVIPAKLKDFPDMFGIPGEKEIMPYTLYNRENLSKNKIRIKKAIKILKLENKLKNKKEMNIMIEQFKLNIKNNGCYIDDKYYNHMKYVEFYCTRDCEILAQGYNIFRKWINEITNLDLNEYISLPSIADNYLINEGCYDGVLELSGTPRAYIQQALVGGRCMTADNKKHHIEQKLQDFDAVSLYPSAMTRLHGFLKGVPKVIPDDSLTYEFIKQKDGYFIDVEFNTDVKINRHFPLLSCKNEHGIRNFTNNIKNEIFTVDNYTLEDVIEFHGIDVSDFKIIRGYYFDEGFNNKIKDKINFLFNERVKKKKEKNKIQSVYKLLMNAAYGKTIMKPISSENKIFTSKDKCFNYVCRNNNYIKYFTNIGGNKWMVKKNKPIDEHYSRPQVGCQILSMSKRIMNEVICLAEDNDINIYYQDTDSMHIHDNQVQQLSNLFAQKYNRELIGSNMGQFHCDFEVGQDNGTIPVSIESYFLGKKCYIDKISCIKNKKKAIEYHIRMKGIPQLSITGRDEDPMDIYNHLYKGKTIEFDLLLSGVKFDFDKNYKIKSKTNFSRSISF